MQRWLLTSQSVGSGRQVLQGGPGSGSGPGPERECAAQQLVARTCRGRTTPTSASTADPLATIGGQVSESIYAVSRVNPLFVDDETGEKSGSSPEHKSGSSGYDSRRSSQYSGSGGEDQVRDDSLPVVEQPQLPSRRTRSSSTGTSSALSPIPEGKVQDGPGAALRPPLPVWPPQDPEDPRDSPSPYDTLRQLSHCIARSPTLASVSRALSRTSWSLQTPIPNIPRVSSSPSRRSQRPSPWTDSDTSPRTLSLSSSSSSSTASTASPKPHQACETHTPPPMYQALGGDADLDPDDDPLGDPGSLWEAYLADGEAACKSKGEHRSSLHSYRRGLDFTLDVQAAEKLVLKIQATKRRRCWCKVTTSLLGIFFFFVSVMLVSLALTRGKRLFGSL